MYMYKNEPVFTAVLGKFWYLYQFKIGDGGLEKIIICNNIKERATAQYMAETLTRANIGSSITVTKYLELKKKAGE